MAAHLRLPALLVFLAMLGGCETSLGPYAPSNRHFSIFGVLNVASDQHWVRIEDLRDGRPIGADSTIDATATLTHLESGRQVTLKDSLFRYQQGLLAHNFYAEMDLQLEHTYRLVVRDSSGNASTATVTMPHSIPEVNLSERGTSATIQGGVEDRLLFLTVDYHTIVAPEQGGGAYANTFTVQYAKRATRTETGYTASLNWRRDVRSSYSGGRATVILTSIAVQVGLVGSDAPVYGDLTYEDLFRPGVAPSNVENGAGYLAGISSDRASVTFPLGRRPSTSVP